MGYSDIKLDQKNLQIKLIPQYLLQRAFSTHRITNTTTNLKNYLQEAQCGREYENKLNVYKGAKYTHGYEAR